MKKILKTLCFIALPVLMGACDIRADLIGIQNDIDDLRGQIDQMNNSVSSLRTLLEEVQRGGIISSLQVLTEGNDTTGYVLSFQDGRAITVHEGVDGYSPRLSVREEDGNWYWTLDGEWILDGDGKRIAAVARNGVDGVDGLTPRLKIIDDFWYLSTDEGENWTQLGRAKGVDAPSVFKAVDASASDHITLTLMDDTVIEIPLYRPVELTLDLPSEDQALAPGETFPIRYTVSGSITEKTVVTAGTDGKFTLSLQRKNDTEGTVYVTCPGLFSEGFVYLLVNDGEGHSVVKVVNFYERRIEVADGLSFHMDCTGGTLTVPVRYNFDYTLECADGCDEWIHIEKTRAEASEGEIVLTVAPNTGDDVRTGRILIRPEDNPSFVYAEIEIVEASAFFSIDKTSFTVESDGREYDVRIRSSRGLSVEVPEDADWLHATLEEQEDYWWTMHVTVDKNRTDERRRAGIQVRTGDGAETLGEIVFTQLSNAVDQEKDFILEMRVSSLFGYTVWLPFAGTVDCVVDWGDGTKEAFDGAFGGENRPSHTYSFDAAETVRVAVSGEVEQLSSDGMTGRDAILAVLQWGDLGLRSASKAFDSCSRLASVPEDVLGAFTDVADFGAMFRQCQSLKTVPAGLFAKAERAESFHSVFERSGIEQVPAGLFRGLANVRDFEAAFAHCKKLQTVPEDLFSGCLGVTSFRSLFEGSTLSEVPAGLFQDSPDVADFSKTFKECRTLVNLPASLFDHNRKVTDFEGLTDKAGTSLCGKESPYTQVGGVKVHLYERSEYPDDFITPLEYGNCLSAFYLDDETEAIPASWR